MSRCRLISAVAEGGRGPRLASASCRSASASFSGDEIALSSSLLFVLNERAPVFPGIGLPDVERSVGLATLTSAYAARAAAVNVYGRSVFTKLTPHEFISSVAVARLSGSRSARIHTPTVRRAASCESAARPSGVSISC